MSDTGNIWHRFGSRTLLFVVGGLFLADVAIPDAVPFVDEMVLGIITILLARWQSRRPTVTPEPAVKPKPKNVTPR